MPDAAYPDDNDTIDAVVVVTEPDPEPEQPLEDDEPMPHWSEQFDKHGVKLGDRLYIKATATDGWALSSEQFFEALGVTDMTKFEGTAKEAAAQIQAWIAAQAE